MLRVKRASAGSGKTYELAKTYIKLLISSKHPGYKRQLLRDESFRDSLSSIMAVTFTVKATAEMKQRIVEKLADLARADEADEAELKKIDYLQEFIDDFNSDRFEIADLCRKALRTLLLHYSDFKVQTIDSFFQSILHTFAYEASLDDNFNVEINSDLVTSAGFDLTLDELTLGNRQTETLYWLSKMMESNMKGNKWNVFVKDGSKSSLYSQLIREAKNLEKEDYQQLKEVVFGYFQQLRRPFAEVVKEVDQANIGRWKALHDARRAKAMALNAILESEGLDLSMLSNYNATPLRESLEEFDPANFVPPGKEISGRKVAVGFSLSGAGEKAVKASAGGSKEAYASAVGVIDAAFQEWMDAANAYFQAFQPHRMGVMTWLEYRHLFPLLMLVLEIAAKKEAYLKATNSMQISDTTGILAHIIGSDDTPFVYERMGARLNHFLIDEFQDTSRMQWRNLLPLLEESEAEDHDNLIIGDAKQSIYRFRNADYSLITNIENDFSNVVYYTSETPPAGNPERTVNWRSKPRVVEFNNMVFSRMVSATTDKGEAIFTPTIRDIYRDCEQDVPAAKLADDGKKSMGYVEAVFYPKVEKDSDSDEKDQYLPQPGFRELPQRILELHGRGYRFRDIGILVKSHEQGMAVVNTISAFNAANPALEIPIISEENLLVASALSVRIVIHAMEMAAGLRQGAKKVSRVLPEPVDPEKLFTLLRSLNTLALPAVVEALIANFVPESRRNTETPFIAAFQDAVVDYSSSRPGDIGSFLKWWKQKSRTLSITSPEESDGVRLQTIHKSKGLEYKCVIIPIVKFSFTPGSFTEWRWVETSQSVADSHLLPPFLPVLTRKELEHTAHAGERVRYMEEFALDELNKLYVAFTRAADELYLYIPMGKRDSKNASGVLQEILADAILPEEEEPTDGRKIATFGLPATPEQIANDYQKKDAAAPEGHTYIIQEYNSWVSDPVAQNDHPLKTIVHPDGESEEIDPRAEGTVKHRIMQMVEVEADLDKALLRMEVEGLVSPEKVEAWGDELRAAIRSVASRGWFAPEMRVFAERPLVKAGMKGSKRPDRFVVSPEGDAVVIDYKFGDEESGYKKQIKEYADLLRETGMFRSVKAYLWYIPEGKIIEA